MGGLSGTAWRPPGTTKAVGFLSALAACPIGARYRPEIVCKQHQLAQAAQVRPCGQRLKRACRHCQARQLQGAGAWMGVAERVHHVG